MIEKENINYYVESVKDFYEAHKDNISHIWNEIKDPSGKKFPLKLDINILEMLENKDHLLFITARDSSANDAPVGMLLLMISPSFLNVNCIEANELVLFVEKPYRKMGIATSMLEHAQLNLEGKVDILRVGVKEYDEYFINSIQNLGYEMFSQIYVYSGFKKR